MRKFVQELWKFLGDLDANKTIILKLVIGENIVSV